MSHQTHPALTPERHALRDRLNLRLVTPEENGMPVDRLPEGVYGYTTSPSSDELPLFTKPIVHCTEVHKPVGGPIHFIGYVTKKDAETFQAGAEPMSLDLFPDPYEEATELISIPDSRVDRRKLPARDHGNPMRMEVAPKPEFLGTASTAN
jgi:hypothetical protein